MTRQAPPNIHTEDVIMHYFAPGESRPAEWTKSIGRHQILRGFRVRQGTLFSTKVFHITVIVIKKKRFEAV